MTSRLKRQLANLGVDASSARSNESFCLIGTPLPPLEKSKDTGEFVPLWKQEVTDEKGRRRLHGAFTGGFSAGYFNTVGSKEGWTPSTFVSSRGDRAKAKTARPEDFMDDEDLAELADNRKLVDTTEELDITGGTSVLNVDDDESNSMAMKLEAALLPPPSDSVGARILKKMGWRVGQGIGPRLSYRQKRIQDAALGVAGDRDIDGDLDDHGEESKHTYAPRDTPLLLPSRKTDTHGHGYQPGMSLYESSGSKNGVASKGPQLSAGFGLGALNDADEDDIDVYDSGISRGKTRMAHDSMDVDDQDMVVMGGSSKVTRHTTGVSQKRDVLSGGTFRDGRPVLNGFVIASQPITEDTWYPLPEVPKGWKADPKRVWHHADASGSTSNAPKVPAGSESYNDWKKGVSVNERGSILGETPLPAATRSVFEYMSQKDRERLQRAASTISTVSNEGPTAPPSVNLLPPSPATIHIPRTEPSIAKAALSGFQPYISDPIKHERYNIYLNSQSHVDGSSPPLRLAPGQSVEAFNKEVSDYAQSAAVFKPLSGAMAGRFTSAAIIESGPKAHEGLYMPDLNKPTEEPAAVEQPQEEERLAEDPKDNAARHSMYGPMTRCIKKWAPARLLCKRFGVKDPELEAHPEEDLPMASSSAAPPKPPVAVMAAVEETADAPAHSTADEDLKQPTRPRDLTNVGLGEDEFQAQDVLTYQRPPLDVFKAIFASDSEDSDNDEHQLVAPPGLPPVLAEPGINPPHVDAPTSTTGDATTELVTSAATTPLSLPSLSSKPKVDADPVDLSTYKPTFVSHAERHSGVVQGSSKGKDRKKTKSLVSFDTGEGEDSGLGAPKVRKRKDKDKHRDKDKDADRQKKRKKTVVDEDDMWVEKPVAEAAKSSEATSTNNAPAVPIPRGRKTAADFM